MGRESRVLPLDRKHVSEVLNVNAGILQGVRDEVLVHRHELGTVQRNQQALRVEHDTLVKFIHLEARHVYTRLEPLNRGFGGRLRWLILGR